jgi:hypothetical protein
VTGLVSSSGGAAGAQAESGIAKKITIKSSILKFSFMIFSL